MTVEYHKLYIVSYVAILKNTPLPNETIAIKTGNHTFIGAAKNKKRSMPNNFDMIYM